MIENYPHDVEKLIEQAAHIWLRGHGTDTMSKYRPQGPGEAWFYNRLGAIRLRAHAIRRRDEEAAVRHPDLSG